METNRQRLIRKWGGIQQWERQKQRHRLKERGHAVGIPHFNLDRYASNTMQSHRLIQHVSRTYGLMISERVYDVLNHYHFVDGHALNDVPKLARTVAQTLQELHQTSPSCWFHHAAPQPVQEEAKAKEVSPVLPPTEAELLEFLSGTEGRAEIVQTVQQVHDLGIDGIPTFLFEGGSTVLHGAVDAAEFVQVFRAMEQRGYLLDSTTVFGETTLKIPTSIIQRGSYHRPM